MFVGKITVGRVDTEVEGLWTLVTTVELGKARKLSWKQTWWIM